jgi:hypothetical protein
MVSHGDRPRVLHDKTATPNNGEIEDARDSGVRPRGIAQPNRETEQSRLLNER